MSQNNIEEQLKEMNTLLRIIARALEGLNEQGIVVIKKG